MNNQSLLDLINKIEDINLSDIENPFNWNINVTKSTTDIIDRFTEKCQGGLEDKFTFKLFICNLCLAYELYKDGKRPQSLKRLKSIEVDLMDEKDQLFSDIKDAVDHVLYSSIAYVMQNMELKTEAEQILKNKILPVEDMDATNQAAISAIKARALMEYNELMPQALDTIEKAVSLDPDNVFWHFLKGKALFRTRRSKYRYDVPTKEEMDEFEFCAKKSDDPMYLVYTAECLCDLSFYLKVNRVDAQEPDALSHHKELDKSIAELFRRCANSESTPTGVLFRCARGLLKLPPPHRDTKLSKELLTRGLEKNPTDVFGRHTLAAYYEKYEKNYEMAKEHLRYCIEAGVFGAYMDMIRISYKETKNHTVVIEQLNKGYAKFDRQTNRLNILCQMASTLLFTTDDVLCPAKCLLKVMEIDAHCAQVMKHYNVMNVMKNSASLYDLVISKINDLLEDDRNPCSPEDKKQFEDFMEQLSSHDISVNVPNDFHKTILYDWFVQRINKYKK